MEVSEMVMEAVGPPESCTCVSHVGHAGLQGATTE